MAATIIAPLHAIAGQPSNGGAPGVAARPSDPARLSLRAIENKDDFTLELGPIDLPAALKGPDGSPKTLRPPTLHAIVPMDGWLHGFSVELVDESGARIPGEVLRQVIVMSPEKRELFTPIMLRVAAAGPGTDGVGLPRLVGYHAHRGDTLLMLAELATNGTREYRGVRVRVRFPLTRDGSMIGAVGIVPFYFDVTPPAGWHTFDLPVGRSEWHYEARPAIGGRILGISGHVLKYATALKLEDLTSKKVVWETRPDTGPDGRLRPLPIKRFLATFGTGIAAGHLYRVSVVYENPTSAPIRDGGEGSVAGVIVPSRGTPWPPVDRNDPSYLLDVKLYWRPPGG